jgi:hypothetical protein
MVEVGLDTLIINASRSNVNQTAGKFGLLRGLLDLSDPDPCRFAPGPGLAGRVDVGPEGIHLLGGHGPLWQVYRSLTLPTAKAGGFSVQHPLLAVASLTRAPRAFRLSVCPTTSILNPSSRMFTAALRSRSTTTPQPHVQVRSESVRWPLISPQSPCNFDEGNQRSMTARCFRFN